MTKYDPGITHIILPVPNPITKGILVAPTALGGVLLGPTAEDVTSKTDIAVTAQGLASIRQGVAKLVPAFATIDSVRQYAGLRAVSRSNDYIIRASSVTPRLLHVAGIRSTGLSASPAIGRYVALLAREMLNLSERNYAVAASFPAVLQTSSMEDVVCLCKGIARSEVIAALHEPLPPTTLDALKRRTHVMFGAYQGNICLPQMVELFQQHLDRDPLTVEKHATASTPITGRFAQNTPVCSPLLASLRETEHVESDALYDVAIVGMGISALSLLRKLHVNTGRIRIIALEHQHTPGGWFRSSSSCSDCSQWFCHRQAPAWLSQVKGACLSLDLT